MVWYSVLILSVGRKKKIIFMDFRHILWEEKLWHFLHFKNSFPVQARGPMHSTESLKDYSVLSIFFAI